MTLQGRIGAAIQYRVLSDRLVLEGEYVAAGEMLWGAVHNAIQAVAIQHNLLDDPNDAIRRAVVIHHLRNRHGYDVSVRNGLRSAGALHGHFYNRNLPADTHQELIQLTRSYIDTLTAIAAPAE